MAKSKTLHTLFLRVCRVVFLFLLAEEKMLSKQILPLPSTLCQDLFSLFPSSSLLFTMNNGRDANKAMQAGAITKVKQTTLWRVVIKYLKNSIWVSFTQAE